MHRVLRPPFLHLLQKAGSDLAGCKEGRGERSTPTARCATSNDLACLYVRVLFAPTKEASICTASSSPYADDEPADNSTALGDDQDVASLREYNESLLKVNLILKEHKEALLLGVDARTYNNLPTTTKVNRQA